MVAAKKKKLNGLWIVAAIGIVLLYILRSSSKSSPAGNKNYPISDEQGQIIQVLQSAGIDYDTARYWSLVSKMETGAWSSELFRKYNNAFGMKQPQKRSTTSQGPSPSGWATYKSLQDSTKDLLLYMREFNYPSSFPSLEDQIVFMKQKGYFEEPVSTYYNLVKAWESK